MQRLSEFERSSGARSGPVGSARSISMKIKLNEVIDGLEAVSIDIQVFLDTETGETILNGEMMDDWEELADLIDDSGDRFRRLPDQWEINEYGMMQDFISELPEGELQNDLWRAISGRGAFRRFKDMVAWRGVDKDWFAFRDAAYRKLAIDWCEQEGLSWVDEPRYSPEG